jgi:hypothetical protein
MADLSQSSDIDLINTEESSDKYTFVLLNEKIKYETDDSGEKIKVLIKIYEKKKIKKNINYYELQKESIKKYREKNKEEIQKKKTIRCRERYQNDEEYREYMKRRRREAYQRQKERKNNNNI